MLKRFATLLTLLTALFLFNSCDDAPPITKTIIEEILTEPIPVNQSRYTGRLIQVGPEGFGMSLHSPVALEWNGENLYMIASRGQYRNQHMYLFTVDRETGTAEYVNPSAHDMGGSFTGRGFTQVLNVSPNDMTWVSYPDHYVKGIDYSHGPHGYMLAVCGVIDSIVGVDLETGMALRGSWRKDYCLRFPEGDTDFDKEFGGYPVIGAGRALGYDGTDLWMWGITGRSNSLAEKGWGSFGQLYKFPRPEGTANPEIQTECVTPVGSPVVYGRTEAEHDAAMQAFEAGEGAHHALPDDGEAHAESFCFDGQHLYASGIDTRRLYIVDRSTGELHFVAKWQYAETPAGYEKHPIGGYINLEENVIAQWAPSVSALAFDGVDMYAIESFTNTLYKLEKR